MSLQTPQVPGLYFTAAPRPAAPSPLRSDVAGFIGRTRRGHTGCLIRVEGWREYLREFGGLDADSTTSYAVRGYFDNGGQVAYINRLCGTEAGTASVDFELLKPDGQPLLVAPAGLRRTAYRIEATSPGRWAREARVFIRYRRAGSDAKPELDFVIHVADEPPEYLSGLDPSGTDENTLEAQLARRSQFIRLRPAGSEVAVIPDAPKGPLQASWSLALKLDADSDAKERPSKSDYLEAIERSPVSANAAGGQRLCPEEMIAAGRARPWGLADEPEVAIVALPDLHTDIAELGERLDILSRLVMCAEESRDRLILVDLPTQSTEGGSLKDADEVTRWVELLRARLALLESPPKLKDVPVKLSDFENLASDERQLRAAVVYHPRLRVADPLGGILRPLRDVPPSGHVAGVISRLDRERGAHHTPANATVFEVVDIDASFDVEAQGHLNARGVNLLRCSPGRGIQVWGGRTLYREESGLFVAHRRLIHRLVRAIRRVAEPLVFHTNGPELWLTFVRTITTVLLEAYRAGGLRGARPDEAFRVRCDERTNPPEEVALGRLLCEIDIAPAVPMEFITLRIAMSADATLEVIEA
jgi:hypothetical protein